MAELKAEAETKLNEMQETVDGFNRRLREIVGELELPEIEVPEPEGYADFDPVDVVGEYQGSLGAEKVYREALPSRYFAHNARDRKQQGVTEI
jgi:hypothetical protein